MSLKLSTAIRLGAMLHPQCFDHYFMVHNNQIVATCAIGAAGRAGYSLGNAFLFGLTTCPVGDDESCPVNEFRASRRGVIEHLNDHHHWTREQIADWVESTEPAPAAVPQHEQLVKGAV